MQEIQIWSLGQEDPLEKEMVTHSSILAWEIPWREEPRGLQSMGSQRLRHHWVSMFSKINGRSLGIRATWGVNKRWKTPGWESTLNKPPDDSIRQKSLINTRLGQCFSNFNVHRTHLGILLRRDSYSVDMGLGEGGLRFHPSYKLSGKSMLLVHGSHLSGRGLEDLPLMEQISFALFLNHRLHCPTSGRIP